MAKLNTGKYRTVLYISAAVVTAMGLRQIALAAGEMTGQVINLLRGMIYSVLFTVWGISIRNRIIHPQVRRNLIAIAVLMVCWIIIRTIRFALDASTLKRTLWYLYYLPMITIPMLTVFVAFSLGKPENYRLPHGMKCLYFPTGILLFLVLTNDVHQKVFIFADDVMKKAEVYSYGTGYFLVFGWILFCLILALTLMIFKCRLPHSHTVLMAPLIPIAAGLAYSVLYLIRVPWLKLFTGDLAAVFCVLNLALQESCIGCGLIQSNTGYEQLFMVSSLGAVLTDHNNQVCLASADAKKLSQVQIYNALSHPILLDHSTLVKSNSISFGHVFWQIDVSQITEVIEQIEENNRDLAERNRIRQKNLETHRKILSLQEKNRVTDLLHRKTAAQIDLIDRMLSAYETETDETEQRRKLAAAAAAGAYIKRYGNLLLVSERSTEADIRDLSRCFDESFINLELLGVNCLQTLPGDITLSTADMLRVYRGFETAVEACLFTLSDVWIHAQNDRNRLLLHMDFVCDTDLSALSENADFFSEEEETYRFTYQMQKGGV